MNVSDVKPGNPRVKETISRSVVARSSSGTNSDSVQLARDFAKGHPRTCDICRRSETVLNPILVCSSCKVFLSCVLIILLASLKLRFEFLHFH